MKKNSKLILIAAALSTISARADLIDVNFYSGAFGGSAASGTAVVGTASDQWNGFDGDSGSGAGSLIDASGTATGASLSFSSLSAVLAATPNFQPNGSLMSQYIYSYGDLSPGPGSANLVTISGLAPNTTFDLYVYLASNDSSGDDRSAQVSANAVSGYATGNPQTTFIDGQNYLLLMPNSGPSGTINISETPGFDNTGSPEEVDMNGLQLNAVPDQVTTFGLLGLSVLGLLLLPKRAVAVR